MNNNIFDIKGFYPTPNHLIDKMLSKIDFKFIESILEPSAGSGYIADKVIKKLEYVHSYSYNREAKWDIDCIEINQNLQYVLQGKKHRIVHDDFLTFNTYKKYDLIAMNPPFESGDKHLLKAIDLQKNGGQIVCLLNAETLRNPYSNTRKELLQKLQDYNADIEYIDNAFYDAERKTDVEVALIRIDIEKPNNGSIILDDLKKQEKFRVNNQNQHTDKLINADFIEGIIQQYNFEIKAGLKLIEEYELLSPLMLNTFKEDKYNKKPILSLIINDQDKYSKYDLKNTYIQQIRMKYWEALFMSEQFMGLFTSNLREQYISQVSELKDYDFSHYNIYTIRIQINKEMIKALEETIINLFEEFSNKHHWYDEMSKNIHYYNGWKTNQSYKINKKVIIPLSAYNNWSNRLEYRYDVRRKLADIEKIFNYLDDGLTEDINLEASLNFAEQYGQTKKIQLKYFTVTFYKKGTCHIEFTNLDLLQKFNLYGSQRKNWLPPSYGKARYHDMTQEEKIVIDEFEGQASYNKVMANTDYYIVETSKLLMLA